MVERRRAELRAIPGRRLEGVAIRYGQSAPVVMLDGRAVQERFVRSAFMSYLKAGQTDVNLMHDHTVTVASTEPRGGIGRLVLDDRPDELRMAVELPHGDVFDQVLALVQDGSTAQTSIEFRSLEERVVRDQRTVIEAELPAIGLVDVGAHRGEVEVRRDGRGLAGAFRYNTTRVTADRGRRRKQSVRPLAFQEALEDLDREIDLRLGDTADRIIASRRAGTLILTDTDSGLEFEIPELPEGVTFLDDFLALLDQEAIAPGVMPLFRIPPADVIENATELVPEDGNEAVLIEVINHAILTSLAVHTRAPRGNPGTVERRSLQSPRRRRLWL